MYPSLTVEQIQARQDIIAHVRKLHGCFGQVHYQEDAFELIREAFEGEHELNRANNNYRLNDYYEKKNQHLMKMAMAVHFSQNTDPPFVINIEQAQEAINILSKLEVKMHYALNFKTSPVNSAIKRIRKTLRNGPMSLKELWLKFECEINDEEIGEALRYLTSNKEIEIVDGNKYKLKTEDEKPLVDKAVD